PSRAAPCGILEQGGVEAAGGDRVGHRSVARSGLDNFSMRPPRMRPMNARRKRTLTYETVKTSIRQRIADGGWQPGVRLPSERELVQQFGCARMTVHRALRELEAEGLIERRQGSGPYVAELHPISNLLHVRDIHDEIVERGHLHTTQVFSVAREKAAPDVASAM